MLKSLKEQEGFTLIEMLICLSIFFIIFLITPRLQPFLFSMHEYKGISLFEWNVFLKQTEIEFREAVSIQETGEKLRFRSRTNELITYQLNGTRLIRKVNQSGYEILLQNVRSVTFQLSENKLSITAVDTQNTTYTRLITRFHAFEVSGK
jgi:competence protein ComGF